MYIVLNVDALLLQHDQHHIQIMNELNLLQRPLKVRRQPRHHQRFVLQQQLLRKKHYVSFLHELHLILILFFDIVYSLRYPLRFD